MCKVSRVWATIGATLLLVTVLAGAASAQMKVGYIDDERIKSEFKDWQRAQDQWQIEQKAWEEEAVSKQTELEDMIEEYDKQKLILSEDKKQERQAAIRAKRDALDAYTKTIFGPGGTAETKQMQLIQPLYEKINTAIETIAAEEGYDIIFSMVQSGLAYIKPEYDITDKVLAQLDKIDQ